MSDLDRYQYGYDQNSDRVWKANVVGTPIVSGGLDEYYAYDNVNRLTEMQRGTLNSGKTGITGTPNREMDYTLDPTGNWLAYLTKTAGTTDLNQTRSQNPVNEITAIASTPGWATPPAYDPAGNMTSFPEPANPSDAYTATYDAWNRMVSVSVGGSTVARYQYDGRDRRSIKLTYSGGTLSETRHFYYTTGWQDIEERVGTSTSMDKQYVWGIRYVDELVCRDDATPQRLYAAQDANYNVTALINTSAAVQERFVYDPYGNSQVLTGSWATTSDAYTWTPRFTGQLFDIETGIFSYRVRFYSSVLGRFTARDPAKYNDGGNLYEYVRGRPNELLDPDGLAAGDCSVTNLGHWGPWHWVANVPGTDLGFSSGTLGATAEAHEIRALYTRLVQWLWVCCKCVNGQDMDYYLWGPIQLQTGWYESGKPYDYAFTHLVQITIPLPIGYGKTAPGIKLTLSDWWWNNIQPNLIHPNTPTNIDSVSPQTPPGMNAPGLYNCGNGVWAPGGNVIPPAPKLP